MLRLVISKLFCCLFFTTIVCAENALFNNLQPFKSENKEVILDNLINKTPEIVSKKSFKPDSIWYATAGRVEVDPRKFYQISVPPLVDPENPTFVKLSKHRRLGFKHGDLLLTPTGIKVLRSGTYRVDFSTTLLNDNNDRVNILIILAHDGKPTLNPNKIVVGVDVIPPNAAESFYGYKILKLKKGARLALVTAGINTDTNMTLSVITWDISVTELSASD